MEFRKHLALPAVPLLLVMGLLFAFAFAVATPALASASSLFRSQS